MTYGGPEFIKMIQKNNKITYIFFYLCWRGGGGGGGGGQDQPAWTACPPGVKITRVGGKISRDSLPPGGATCPGGQDKLLHRYYALFEAKHIDGTKH